MSARPFHKIFRFWFRFDFGMEKSENRFYITYKCDCSSGIVQIANKYQDQSSRTNPKPFLLHAVSSHVCVGAAKAAQKRQREEVSENQRRQTQADKQNGEKNETEHKAHTDARTNTRLLFGFDAANVEKAGAADSRCTHRT